MKISRQKLLGAAATAGPLLSNFCRYPGDTAEFTYKLASNLTLSVPLTTNSLKAASRILEATGGRVDIKVFPNSALGDDTSMVTQLRAGMEFVQTGPNILTSSLPAAALEAMPFTFGSQAELMKAVNGPLGRYVADAAAKTGLYQVATTWYGGVYQMENNLRPIVTPADFKGLQVRVPAGPIEVATFKAFGAIATPLPASEVYVALQTRLVDAIEVPTPNVQSFKWYEVVKYVSLTSHKFSTFLTMANTAAWQKLTKKLPRHDRARVHHGNQSGIGPTIAGRIASRSNVEIGRVGI